MTWFHPEAMRDDRPPEERPVPFNSGEGALYTIEYLTKREGNAYGTQPYEPRSYSSLGN